MALLLAAGLAGGLACSDSTRPGPRGTLSPRTYRMGFSAIPPRPDSTAAVNSILMWVTRADAGIFHSGAPWDTLLAGVSPVPLIQREFVPLAQFYRSRGMSVVIMVDPTNGLNRAAEDQVLVDAGRSLTEPAVQQLLREYIVAVDTLVRPDYLGVAAETNLIRAVAPPALYDAVRQVANDAAADVRAADAAAKLFASVQVEVAWGILQGGVYQGVDADRADFPFIEVLGLSSYPYFANWAHPDSIPTDYYARLVSGSPIPVMVVEGGWSSEKVSAVETSPAVQADYIRRQALFLDEAGALAVFPLTFTDLDTAAIPLPPGVSLGPFAFLGLVDVNLARKPALGEWDEVFLRPLAAAP